MNRKLLLIIMLVLGWSDVMACYVAGSNPDYAYANTNPTTIFASPDAACTAKINPSYSCGACTDNIGLMQSQCLLYTSTGSPAGATNIDIITGDAGYGVCTGDPAENTASVCNDGQVTLNYNDPACTDGTTFTPEGQNVVSTTTIDVSSEVTQDITTDNDGNVTTVETTTDTTTTTTTESAGDQITDVTVSEDITETIVTTVEDDQGNVISSTTTINETSGDTPQDQGFGSASSSCNVQPTCSGDPVGCANLLQNWYAMCNVEPPPDHILLSSDFETTGTSFSDRIDNSPIVLGFSNFANVVTAGSGTCPNFSIDLPAPISATVSTIEHCNLFDVITPFISVVMFVVYGFLGFKIIASA